MGSLSFSLAFYLAFTDTLPPLDDLDVFPDRPSIDRALQFNQVYEKHLRVQQLAYRSRFDEIQATLDESCNLYWPWQALGEARQREWPVPARRQALARLRDLIGPEAYLAGRMPPCVPWWRFRMVGE